MVAIKRPGDPTKDPTVVALRQERQDREERLEDGLDEFHKTIVKTWARLELPQNSVYNLRIVARYLHELANTYEHLSRRDDLPPYSILLQAQTLARACNARLRKLRNVGRETF